MNVAEGSVEECRYFLILASDLRYGDTSNLSELLDEVSRMLNAYASAILICDSLRLCGGRSSRQARTNCKPRSHALTFRAAIRIA